MHIILYIYNATLQIRSQFADRHGFKCCFINVFVIYIYIHMTLLKLYILWGQSTSRIPVHPWSGLWNATSTVIYWKNIIQQCYRLEPNIVYIYIYSIVAYNYSVVYIYISIRLDSISNHMGKSLVLPDPPPSSGSGSWQCAWGYGVGCGGWNMMKPRLGPCNGGGVWQCLKWGMVDITFPAHGSIAVGESIQAFLRTPIQSCRDQHIWQPFPV